MNIKISQFNGQVVLFKAQAINIQFYIGHTVLSSLLVFKIMVPLFPGSMLTAASPPPCTARMRDCLLTQEDHQVVVEVPALLSLLSLHPPVLAQYLPAGHQDNLMVTALTLDYAALMAAATLVEKVGRGKWKGPYC